MRSLLPSGSRLNGRFVLVLLLGAGCYTVPVDGALPPAPDFASPGDVDGPLYVWDIEGTSLPPADAPPTPKGGPLALLQNIPSPCQSFRGDTLAVRLRYVVDAEGQVIAAGPVGPASERTYRAVAVGLARTAFEPGRLAGDPVPVLVEGPFTFRCWSESTVNGR